MQISVFKKIPLPKNKEEKGKLAKFSSSPYLPEVIECNGIKKLLEIVTNYGYSPSIFSDTRKKANFKHTDYLVLDIDEDLTIEKALERVENHNLLCICLPTSSHTPELNKFRLIFPLAQRISKEVDFVSNMKRLNEIFPESDKQCVTDSARFFFPSVLTDEGFIYEGELFAPEILINEPRNLSEGRKVVSVGSDIETVVESIFGTKRERIPESVDYFIRNAHTGLPQEWNNHLNAFCFSLAINGLDYDNIYDIVEKLAPEPIDSRDEYTIKRSFNDGHGVYLTNGDL